jgi:Tol biopolymer transport system component
MDARAHGQGWAGRRWRLFATLVLLAIALNGVTWWIGRQAPVPDRGPVQIARLTEVGTVLDAALSPDGTAIAWVEAHGDHQALVTRPLGGGEAVELVPPAAVEYRGLTFAPDGARVLYLARSSRQPAGALYAIARDGGSPALLLEDVDSPPALSADGRWLAFLRADHPGHGMTALVVADADGSAPRVVAAVGPPQSLVVPAGGGPSWSADGSRLAALAYDTDADSARVVTIDVATGAVVPVSGPFRDAVAVAWLPDDSGLLVEGARPDGARAYARGVWLQPYPAGEPRRVTPDSMAYDGISLRRDGEAFVAVGRDAAYSLWAVPLDGDGQAERVVAEPGDGRLGLAPLADGRLVVAVGETGNEQLALIEPDGSSRQILTTRGANRSPAVTPDGRVLVFVSDRDGREGIWRLDLDGSEARLLAHVPNPSWLSVTPDGLFVVCVSRDGAGGAPSTWRVSIDGGEPAIIAPGIDRPRVSPDGQLLAGVTVAPQGDRLILITMRLDGRAPPRALGTAEPSQDDGLLEWTPEGDGLLYSDPDRIDVWMQPLSGDRPLRVTGLGDLAIVRGRATPGGHGLVVARGRERADVYLISGFR